MVQLSENNRYGRSCFATELSMTVNNCGIRLRNAMNLGPKKFPMYWLNSVFEKNCLTDEGGFWLHWGFITGKS